MKFNIRFNKRDLRVIGITLLVGLVFGWLFFHGRPKATVPASVSTAAQAQAPQTKTIWICSMHPQIRMDHPGRCPICGMELIPVQQTVSAASPNEIAMTADAMKLADVQTTVVVKAHPDKRVYLLGKIRPDERNIAELTARFGGRIERLDVNFTGQTVARGGRLARIYSPALMTAQKELLEAIPYKQTSPDLYRAARNKLSLWDLTEPQIDGIEAGGKAESHFDILSPIAGTVTRRDAAMGDYVKEGSALFQVIDLRRVWAMFEAYESDLPWISVGDKVAFTVPSLPGRTFTGRVGFIDRVIDPATRIAQVRVEVGNPGLVLKPDMFANGIVMSAVAARAVDLVIPKTAVLWTGKRSIVYVKMVQRPEPTFAMREVTLGPSAGEFYVVSGGLQEGEEIATNGVFKIDAAAQLAGKPSMMDPQGNSGQASGGTNAGGMNMGGK